MRGAGCGWHWLLALKAAKPPPSAVAPKRTHTAVHKQFDSRNAWHTVVWPCHRTSSASIHWGASTSTLSSRLAAFTASFCSTLSCARPSRGSVSLPSRCVACAEQHNRVCTDVELQASAGEQAGTPSPMPIDTPAGSNWRSCYCRKRRQQQQCTHPEQASMFTAHLMLHTPQSIPTCW